MSLQSSASALMGLGLAPAIAQKLALSVGSVEYAAGEFVYGSEGSITAHAGGGQAFATAIPGMVTKIATVATAGDSVLLPVTTTTGLILFVGNAGANSANVFPQTGDQINALGANAAFALAAGKNAIFFSPVAGQWFVVLSA